MEYSGEVFVYTSFAIIAGILSIKYPLKSKPSPTPPAFVLLPVAPVAPPVPVVVVPVPVAPVAPPVVVVPLNPFSSLDFETTETQAKTILELTSIFENSTKTLQYDYVEDINDGRGYTFGFVGFCSGTFDGSIFLEEFKRLTNNSVPDTQKYLDAMKAIDAQSYALGIWMNPSKVGLENFIEFVKKNGNRPEWIQANLNIANRLYVIPSQLKAKELGLTKALSKGQLYDSYLNHGESGALVIIRTTGALGMNERDWLKRYLINRKIVLSNDSTWASSTDRIKVYESLLDNMDLNLPFNVTCYGDSFLIN